MKLITKRAEMNDMQKLAFEIGRQIELEKLAVLAKARKAVKTYWGHLSGKTLKGAKKDNERAFKAWEDANHNYIKTEKHRDDLKRKFTAQERKSNVTNLFDRKTDPNLSSKLDDAEENYSKARKSFFKADSNVSRSQDRLKDALKSKHKARIITAGVGGGTLTGGGAYAYNKNKGNKK